MLYNHINYLLIVFTFIYSFPPHELDVSTVRERKSHFPQGGRVPSPPDVATTKPRPLRRPITAR